MKRDPVARATAKNRGDRYYTTGIPCKQGHLAPRATATGTCVECTRAAARAWHERHADKGAKYTAAYRARNRAVVLEKDRVAHAVARAVNPEGHKRYRKKHYADKALAEGREVRPYNRLPIDTLLDKLKQIHGTRLAYVSGYEGKLKPALFHCVTHKLLVYAAPNNVLRGANPCSQCNHMKSAQEDALARMLSVFTPVVQRDRTVLKPRELDLYLPEKKLAIEYCGMFWHSYGDAETEREKKRRHYEKYVACAQKGIRLLTVYESEWQQHNYAIRRLLRNAVGKSRGRLMARKCELHHVENAEARAFYDRYHPQGGAGNGVHYGLFWKDKLVACMRFSHGANDRGASAANRVWTLSRYATRITVSGGASRLFKAFLADYNPSTVKSFSDNRYFAGAMYEKLGFTLEAEVDPDYQIWSQKVGLLPKSHYQRRKLRVRLLEHGLDSVAFDPETDPRTEADITYLMGARRIYDCGKKRWVFTC